MNTSALSEQYRCAYCGGEISGERVAAALTRGRKPTYCSGHHRAAQNNALSYLRRHGRENPHVRIDRRSMAFHRLIATKIETNPGIVARARDNIDRWSSQGSQEAYLDEWRRILSGDPREIAQFLRSSGQRATRLRQSSPFTGVLSREERAAIMRAYR
ncbi:hypothetical protein EPN42_10905 [bacterium]|nr:MAG: hypothetical protein EPN42_10905 [bacterium]